MEKKTIAVIFGGQSSEHEISCISAATVITGIDPEKYDLLLIGITRDGRWLFTESPEALKDGSWEKGSVRAVLAPDAGVGGALLIRGDSVSVRKVETILL